MAVDSCTNVLCCKYLNVNYVTLARTYLSIPMSIIHSGGKVIFDKDKTLMNGKYIIKPYQIWDSAKSLH